MGTDKNRISSGYLGRGLIGSFITNIGSSVRLYAMRNTYATIHPDSSVEYHRDIDLAEWLDDMAWRYGMNTPFNQMDKAQL